MSKKSLPIMYSNWLYKLGHDFLDSRYDYLPFVATHGQGEIKSSSSKEESGIVSNNLLQCVECNPLI